MSEQSQSDAPFLMNEWSLGLGEFFREFWLRKWLVLAITGACLATGTAYAFLARPVYRVTAVLIPADTSGDSLGMRGMDSLGSLGSLVGINVGGAADQTIEALAVLASRRFTVNFILDNKLLPRLFEGDWDAEHGKWAVPEGEVPTEVRAYKFFDQDVRSISQDKKTGIVTLTIDWVDRDEAVVWARDLVNRVNEEMRARAIHESTASLERLEKQIAQTNVVAVQESLAKLIETQVRRKILAMVRPDYAFRIVDPPAAPDADDPERPKKLLVLLLSVALGVFISAAVVLSSARTRSRRDFRTASGG
jgi:hypothetical protein